MSTRFDTSTTDDRRPPDAPEPEEKKKPLDLSLTQIVGGALAAMTAAALGSTLGVGGTVAGAALASVVAGVAGSLYTASLRSGRERVRTVLRTGGTTADSAPPAPIEPATTVIPRTRTETPSWDPLPADDAAATAVSRAVRFPWKRAVAITLAVFALAAVLITGYERVSGASLSGGSGTTVTQVGRDTGTGRSGGDSSPAPSSSDSSAPTSSSSPSDPTTPGVGSEPSASESPATPAPSASESSPTPSASGSPTPSADPTSTATAG